jgi:farnesyl diphosphate synthase
MTQIELAQQLQQYRQRVDASLAKYLPQATTNDADLAASMRYSALLGGKRVRPALAYAAGELGNANHNDLDRVAAAIELIHAYSLVHDDLPAMDDDDLRRGQPTCHIQFSEATAILAGDALQSQAFLLLAAPMTVSAEQQLKLVHSLAQAAGYAGMVGGQALDLAATNKAVSLDYLENMHLKKTGALIMASLELGAGCASSLSQADHKHLLHYGRAIGLAFQVKDDLLDIEGKTEQLGKRQGSDQQKDKSTYPALLGLDGARKLADQLYQDALDSLASLSQDTEFLSTFAHYIIHRES